MERYYVYLCFGDVFVPGPDPTQSIRKSVLEAIATNEKRANEWLAERLHNQPRTIVNPYPNIPMYRVQRVEMLR